MHHIEVVARLGLNYFDYVAAITSWASDRS